MVAASVPCMLLLIPAVPLPLLLVVLVVLLLVLLLLLQLLSSRLVMFLPLSLCSLSSVRVLHMPWVPL
jgi:hypothetical protein